VPIHLILAPGGLRLSPSPHGVELTSQESPNTLINKENCAGQATGQSSRDRAADLPT